MVWRIKVDKENDPWTRYCCPCERCGRSHYFFSERTEPYICYGCRRYKEKKLRKKKRGMASMPHPAKPLSPGGETFVPDKMDSLKYVRQKAKDDVAIRQNRKRQRRVDKYMIDLAFQE